MIKYASGDWQRRIPPWADTQSCDLRRYRGPYNDALHDLRQKLRALDRVRFAMKKARTAGVEFLMVRCGDRALRRDALHSLLRGYFSSPECAGDVDLGKSRQYSDRIVVALRTAAPQNRSTSSD